MSGPEHYREAERLIDLAAEHEADDSPADATSCYRAAQVHATLALAAATATCGYMRTAQQWLDELNGGAEETP